MAVPNAKMGWPVFPGATTRPVTPGWQHRDSFGQRRSGTWLQQPKGKGCISLVTAIPPRRGMPDWARWKHHRALRPRRYGMRDSSRLRYTCERA